MGRSIFGVSIAGLAVALFAWSSVKAGPDSAVPPALAPWVEPAREAARIGAGLVGLAPARLIDARCSDDGRMAVLTFESAIGSARAFATIGFPSPEDWAAPGATVAIIGSDLSITEALSTAACDLVSSGAQIE